MLINKLKYLYILVFFVANSILPESIVTTKEDLPDAYFGLKVGAVVSPSFGYRLRDSSSGVSNAKRDDRTGFSMPWTLFMISKEWEEKKVTVEFWGEVLRSSSFSADTTADNGSKSNPYILGIRRASVKKNIEYGIFNFSLIFGIHELPHLYTQWNGYWKWRYVDRAPMESLGFSPQAADLGASLLLQVKKINFHVGVVNGEGYRDIQNSTSSGYDAVSRLSFEPEFKKVKMGFHFLGRAGNFSGVAGNECQEGKGNCIPNDNNEKTRFERDLRYQKSQTLGFEYTFLFDKFVNFGAGFLDRKIFQGITYDKLNPTTYPDFQTDLRKTAGYVWFGFGYSNFNFVVRTEQGRGGNGLLATTSQNGQFTFKKNSFLLEYLYSDLVRFAIGGSELRQGFKSYITYFGDVSDRINFENQFKTGINNGIVEYSFVDKQLFIKSTMDF